MDNAITMVVYSVIKYFGNDLPIIPPSPFCTLSGTIDGFRLKVAFLPAVYNYMKEPSRNQGGGAEQ